MRSRQRLRVIAVTAGAIALVAAVVAFEWTVTAPVRESMSTFLAIIGAADAGDMAAVRARCSRRFLATGELTAAKEGGLEGIPRRIHPNHSAWREQGDVLVCTGNREGPVYRFVHEPEGWRFDGLFGVKQGDGTITRTDDDD